MEHIPVLKSQVIEQFLYFTKISKGIFFDGTLGAGGHAIALTKELKEKSKEFRVIGVDQDLKALEIAKRKISEEKLDGDFVLIHDNFRNIKRILENEGIKKIDGVLLDLGVSSMQFDDPTRGFSFKDPNQILDMRMDQTKQLSAKEILNSYTGSDLFRIFKEYGEERFSKQIAEAIVEERKKKKIETVGDLLIILEDTIPKKFRLGKIHYATKIFQSLRIEVNSELEKLEQSIFDISQSLNRGGRLAIITFHSLEDRIVKHAFQKMQDPCICPPKIPCICGKKPSAIILSKKPTLPSEEEVDINPRARSAKLRVIEKL